MLHDADFISGSTRLFAVIGDPVRHSLSPRIMNAAFRACGIDAVYVALPVKAAEARQAMQMIRSFEFGGCNVTMPLKQEIVPWLDHLAPEAAAIGAVNCVLNQEGVLVGHNTDCTGFRLSLSAHFSQPPQSAFLLGAGGAARAIASELVRWGCPRLIISNRSREKAEELKQILKGSPDGQIDILPWEPLKWGEALGRADMVVNATSLGMGGQGSVADILDWSALNPAALIYETVYNPLETDLLRVGRQRGINCVEGTEMLLWQAAAGFSLWTGRQAPVTEMKRALLQSIPAARL